MTEWGTVYELERQKACGMDPKSLLARIDDLRAEIDLLKTYLSAFTDQDWYAAGHGKFQATVPQEILEAAKALLNR